MKVKKCKPPSISFLHNIQCIAKKELSYIYGVMFKKQTVKAKKYKPPRMTFYVISNASQTRS